jgi:septum formation protein
MTLTMIHLILASASPRRRELIQQLALPFAVQVADVDEDSVTDPDPATNAVQTARLKATAVTHYRQSQAAAAARGADGVIVAADTTVAIDGAMLNKPAHEDDAWRMLRLLRGRTHQVHTGLVVVNLSTGQTVQAVASVAVTMRAYSDKEIAAYIATGDPLDKAGAYAIQHPLFRPVARLDGCYTAVVGLPLCHLACALIQVGVALAWTPDQVCAVNPDRCPFYSGSTIR